MSFQFEIAEKSSYWKYTATRTHLISVLFCLFLFLCNLIYVFRINKMKNQQQSERKNRFIIINYNFIIIILPEKSKYIIFTNIHFKLLVFLLKITATVFNDKTGIWCLAASSCCSCLYLYLFIFVLTNIHAIFVFNHWNACWNAFASISLKCLNALQTITTTIIHLIRLERTLSLILWLFIYVQMKPLVE